MITRFLIPALVALCVLVPAAQAARPIDPPLKEFTSNRHNLVMAAQVAEKMAPNKVRFDRLQAYAGDVKASVVLRMDEETFAELQLEQSYIVAYTYVTSDPQFRESKYEDPDGPSMISLRGLGTPALFEDTADTRFLFESATRETPPDRRDVVEALTRQMAREDARTRAFAVVELLMRRELYSSVLPSHGQRIAAVVEDTSAAQELRAFLLEAAVSFPDRSQGWLRAACRKVIAELQPQFALETHGPQLATAALVAMGYHGAADDVEAMIPFLGSNAPKVVSTAIESIEVLLLREGRASPSR